MVHTRRSARPDWFALPDSVQAHILQLLPPGSLRRARLACKAWGQLVPGPTLANKQQLTLGGPLSDTEEEVAAILQRCPSLASLTLLQQVSTAALASLATQLPCLTQLVCCQRDEHAFPRQLAAMKHFTGLRSLHVSCPRDCEAWDVSRCQLDVCGLTALVSLRLTGYPAALWPADLACARSLTELHLESEPYKADLDAVARAEALLTATLPELTQLRSLHLRWIEAENEGALARLLATTALQGLTCLHLPVNLQGGPWLCQGLRRLTSLQDLRAGGWDVVNCVARLGSLTTLTRLHWRLGSSVVEPLHVMLGRLPRLAELCMRHATLGDDSSGLLDLTALTALTARLGPGGAQAHLAAAPQLRRFCLVELPLLHQLPAPPMPGLQELDLSHCSGGDVWLPALATQLPGLRSLALSPCYEQTLTPSVAARLALTQLRLTCDCSQQGGGCLDNGALACLASLTALEELSLAEAADICAPRRPRACMKQVACSRSLRRLTLCGVRTGDRDCAALAAMASLECVTYQQHWDLRRARASVCRPPSGGAGLAALLSSGCKVVYADHEGACEW